MMKIKTLVCGLLLGVLGYSCGDNEAGSASHLDENWYKIEYDPNAGELDQLIYDVYANTGFPIFYSDTIGWSTRYDHGGNSYTHYEIFKPGYSFTGSLGSIVFTIQRDESKIQMMVELLRDYVIEPYMNKEYGSNFKGKYGPHAFLVLDTLMKGKVADSLYRDLGVLALSSRFTMSRGKVKNFIPVEQMTEEEKKGYGWRLAMYELKYFFEVTYKEELQAYFNIPKETPDFYEKWDKKDLFELGAQYNTQYTDVVVPDYLSELRTNPMRYGGLRYAKGEQYGVTFPSTLQDLMDFMEMIYTKTDTEIRAEHGEYSMIIKRYEALLNLLKKSGLTQFIKEQ